MFTVVPLALLWGDYVDIRSINVFFVKESVEFGPQKC